MNLPGTLQDLFKVYSSSVTKGESWKMDHDEAMVCLDVEEVVALGLMLYESLERRKESWTLELERNDRSFTWEEARFFDELYKLWLSLSNHVLPLIDRCDAKGYAVKFAKEFRAASRDVSLMPLDTDRNRKSVESLWNKSGIPSKQAMDELRDRLRSRGS